jgi:D-alanyl-lipoteichoic acid acyltransferase DltB (MBOAT superfamily)
VNASTETALRWMAIAAGLCGALGAPLSALAQSQTVNLVGAAATAGVAGSPYAIVPSAAVGTGLANYSIAYVNGGGFFGSRRTWLVVSIVNNFAILAFFKYARFLIENINTVLASGHVRLPDPSTLMPFGAGYLLPAGISFFTFQSLSYTIDFYRGLIPRERNFLRFATFVAFFPQLMAGPIERAAHMLPQFVHFPKIRLQNFTDGLSLFLVGLFKKLALANYLSLYVERVYDNPKQFDAPELLAATFAFAWQIFFDFSGYTDMARGIAKVMGFDLMLNFNNPYLATGLGDFWSRWHISLSTWFRDYVYIPLGGNRRGSLFTYRNLFLTFFISGIWHGAAWTFVIWGVLHALGILITRELERSAFYRERVPHLAKQLATFAFVCFAWIFFRAGSLSDATLIISRIFAGAWHTPQVPALMLLLVTLIWLYQFAFESRFKEILQTGAVRVGLAVFIILYLCLFATEGGAFIYFQF